MRVLVVDTALNACSAAVFENAEALAVRSEPMNKGHQERIGGLVRDVVTEAGGGFEAIDRIGVTVGPGSFTGLRVGLAFAQGLGAALNLPVIGISTLEALARSGDSADLVAAVIDARRCQVYLQTFRDGVPDGEPCALAIETAGEALAGTTWRLVGNGAHLLAEASPDSVAESMDAPTPEALAALTIAADADSSPPRPLYLRAPDATPPTRLPGQPRPARA